jgi:hypothetical protein
MGNLSVAATETTGALPGTTPSGPKPQQRVNQQDNDRISTNAKQEASAKVNTIPRGNGQPSAKKENETQKSRFSRVVVDGLTSGKFWLGVLGSSAIMLLIFFIDDSIKNSSGSSSNMPMKH